MVNNKALERIELVTDGLRYEEKEILVALRNRGLPVKERSVSSYLFDLGNTKAHQNALSLIRIPSYFKRTATSYALQSSGSTVLNSPEDISIFGRKSSADYWMAERGLPNIPAYRVVSVDTALVAAKRLGFPVVVKPDIGGFGRRVHLIENAIQLEQLVETVLDLAQPYNRFVYVQKMLNVVFDLRVMVLFGEIIGVMSRRNDESFSKNISRGGVGKAAPDDILPAKLHRRIREVLPVGLYGVDVFITEDGSSHICEINANCQFKEFDRTTGIRVGTCLAEQVERLLRFKRNPALEE